ncbi:MAG TPA: cellulase family glycosylhydrolase [Thermoleophilaceae bacterium]
MPRLLVLAVATAALALAAPGLAKAAPSRFDIGIQDPLEFPEQDPQGAYSAAKAEGVRFVRLPVTWSNIARERPNDPTNPNDPQYQWSLIDGRLDAIRSRGMVPLLEIYAAPPWAHGSRLTANVGDFASFVTAVARRYDGGARPRVQYFQMWNEPNLKMFLDDSPARYRALVNAGYKAVKAVHSDNIVIAGGLAPFSDPENRYGIGPMPYMRSLLKGKISFDIWSHHPYTSGGPNHKAALEQEASIGDLPRMRKLLLSAYRAGKVGSHGAPGFWVTEFGWDTKPPDPGGVPLAQHARWVAEAMYRMWQSDVSTMFWFKLRDDPFNGDWGAGFQGGMFLNTTALYANEKRKPVADVLRFPFAAVPEGGRVSVWGRTPKSRAGKVTIEMAKGSSWISIAKVGANSHGLFRLKLNGRRGARLRARAAGSPASYPFSAVHTTDMPVRPFGGG